MRLPTRKWKRVVFIPLLISVAWLVIWVTLIATEVDNMVGTSQDLERVPGQHILVRLINFDGVENVLDVGWTPLWCKATNDCKPFRAATEDFNVPDMFDIPLNPNRHALYDTRLRIRNNDDPNPSVYNPWVKWRFSYPFDSGVALMDIPMSKNESQQIKGVVLSGFLFNVRIGVDAQWGSFCLARETPPCNVLRINLNISRWRIVKVVVVVVALINWVVTLAVCTMAIMVTYHIRNEHPQPAGREPSDRDSESLSVLAAQFGAIFTIPSLRAILPDIPPTACVFDLVAIIPNIFIITFTSSALLAILAIKKLRGAKPTSPVELVKTEEGPIELAKTEEGRRAAATARIGSSYGRVSPFAFPLPSL